jgi:hypothetical protein
LSNDIAQTNLAEPNRVDWDTAFSGGKYSAPPPALGPDGKTITYYGLLKEAKEVNPDIDRDSGDGFLQFQLDLGLTRAGEQFDGQRLRAWASTRTFTKENPETGQREPMKGNPNKLASFLRAAGLQAKPNTNAEYRASVRAVNGKAIPFTIDWVAKNKETGEKVEGFLNFPMDPERPGQRKSILKRGDVVQIRDRQGNVIEDKIVQSEVLFANPVIKYFQSPSK